MALATVPETPGLSEDIREYRIHVSSKYLDLTRQKLELTRLPHETSEPISKDWWEPKAEVEPLIDYWLEHYSWRDQESRLNTSLPQFRTAILLPSIPTPIRIHFIHARSPRPNPVPLLLLPPFPFANLSLGHLIAPLTEPQDDSQAFHVVIPALPGLGFSDALPNNTPMIPTTAEILNLLMGRLGYELYIVSNAGSANLSPALVDWKLANRLATTYSASCVGTHFIAPPLASPKINEAPLEWSKWTVASLFQAPILGYLEADFSALDRVTPAPLPYSQLISQLLSHPYLQPLSRLPFLSGSLPLPLRKKVSQKALGLDFDSSASREPNTIAYALCDSPTGLLVFVLKALRILKLGRTFSAEEIVTFTQLAWLPGPEGPLRFWAYCAQHTEEETTLSKGKKPVVGITVFLGDEEPVQSGDGAGDATTGIGGRLGGGGTARDTVEDIELGILPTPAANRYACPGWGNAHYDVRFANRVSGRPGLLAWERPEIITEGVRGLAKEVLALDSRLRPADQTVPLEGVIIGGGRNGNNEIQGSGAGVRNTPGLAARHGIGARGSERPVTPAQSSRHGTTEDEETPRPSTREPVHDAPRDAEEHTNVVVSATQDGEESRGRSTTEVHVISTLPDTEARPPLVVSKPEPRDDLLRPEHALERSASHSPDVDPDFDGESPDTIVATPSPTPSPLGGLGVKKGDSAEKVSEGGTPMEERPRDIST